MSTLAEYRDVRVSIAPPYETVAVTLRTPTPARDAWRAITEPPQVRRWLGTLWAPLTERASARLDFGDGDFFALKVRRLEPPHLVEYTWRFLGIGPSSRIAWTVEPTGECECEVTVSDRQRRRSRDETLALATGWADFVERLARYLKTGKRSRYDWRSDVDASILLPIDVPSARALLDASGHAAWLPVPPSGAEPGARFSLDFDEELSVLEAERTGPDTVTIGIGHRDWGTSTRCVLDLTERGRHALLEVHHTGFRSVPIDERRQRRLRQAAARGWVSALERGRRAGALAANGTTGP